ncbi:MAG: phosphatase PAP2 family protein [Gallionellaceae bacterium]
MITKTEFEDSLSLTPKTMQLNSAWVWAVPVFSGAALAALLLTGTNVALFYWMNSLFSHAYDGLWTHLSLIADGQFLFLFILPFLGRRPDIVWQYILAFLLAGLYIPAMKEFFSELRPPAVLLEGSFHLIGPALQNNSFPSGHTTAAFALAGLACLLSGDNRVRFGALLLAVMVGFSRIANGVHWPLDVLAGAMGGWLLALAAVHLSAYWKGAQNVKTQRVFALLLIALALWGMSSLLLKQDDVYPGTQLLKLVFLFTSFTLCTPGLLRLFNLRKLLI